MKELDKAITALEDAKAKIQAMLAQNNEPKTADDAQNNGNKSDDCAENKGNTTEVENSVDDAEISTPIWDGHLDHVLEFGDVNVNVNCWDGNSYMRMATWEEVCKVHEDGNLKITPDGLTLDFSHKKEVESPDGRFVEYPVYVDECNEYVCDVVHHKDNRSTIQLNIIELHSIVGFVSIWWDNTSWDCGVWSNTQPDHFDEIPATPIKARFWIETPPLNDK